jgi:hypothetical protein
MNRLRPHLSYANVMATIAVFVAFGGSAVAAATITGRNIQDGTVTGHDVKTGTLQSSDVKDGTLRKQDFLPGVLSSAGSLTTPLGQAEGATGPQGPQGERGATGPAGKDGTNGTNGAPGTNGTNGRDGTAVAYATIGGGGASNTPFVQDSKNLTAANVASPAGGVYCLHDLPFTFKSVMVTALGAGTASPQPGNADQVANVTSDPSSTFGSSTSACKTGTQVVVTIYDVGQALVNYNQNGTFAPPTFSSTGSAIIWFEN